MPQPRGSNELTRTLGPPGVVLALSGPVCGGKTTLARGLTTGMEAAILSTRELLIGLAPEGDRRTLQQFGEDLDRREAGAWVSRPAFRARTELDISRPLIVDAVRTAEQISALRVSVCVVHIHLAARVSVLKRRYDRRRAIEPGFELAGYDAVRANPTEMAVDELAGFADLVLRTDLLGIEETQAEAQRFLHHQEAKRGTPG